MVYAMPNFMLISAFCRQHRAKITNLTKFGILTVSVRLYHCKFSIKFQLDQFIVSPRGSRKNKFDHFQTRDSEHKVERKCTIKNFPYTAISKGFLNSNWLSDTVIT